MWRWIQSLWRRANARNVSFFTLYGGQFTFSTHLLTLNYLLYPRFWSIAGQLMRLHSFTQWILPAPKKSFRDPGPSRIGKLRVIAFAAWCIPSYLPSFLSFFFSCLPVYLSSVLFSTIPRASIKETRLDQEKSNLLMFVRSRSWWLHHTFLLGSARFIA